VMSFANPQSANKDVIKMNGINIFFGTTAIFLFKFIEL
jgi:hypothetical protein